MCVKYPYPHPPFSLVLYAVRENVNVVFFLFFLMAPRATKTSSRQFTEPHSGVILCNDMERLSLTEICLHQEIYRSEMNVTKQKHVSPFFLQTSPTKHYTYNWKNMLTLLRIFSLGVIPTCTHTVCFLTGENLLCAVWLKSLRDPGSTKNHSLLLAVVLNNEFRFSHKSPGICLAQDKPTDGFHVFSLMKKHSSYFHTLRPHLCFVWL